MGKRVNNRRGKKGGLAGKTPEARRAWARPWAWLRSKAGPGKKKVVRKSGTLSIKRKPGVRLKQLLQRKVNP